MKFILTLIFGWAWTIIKTLLVGLILSLIWPDIQIETVLAVMTLYAVITTIYKASKK